MTVDLSPIVQALVGVAALVVSAAGPIIAAAIVRRLHLAQGSAAAQAVTAATETGAGIAYAALVARSHQTASIEIHNAALAAGVQHVVEAVPGAMQRVGVTEETAARMVTGKLGALLARDATVSPGPSVTVPPPVLPTAIEESKS